MAKITANGATEVARWALMVQSEDGEWGVPAGSALLRSDGVVLRKGTIKGERWTRAFTLKAQPTDYSYVEAAVRVLGRRGYVLRRI
jgi:hypothetical protein